MYDLETFGHLLVQVIPSVTMRTGAREQLYTAAALLLSRSFSLSLSLSLSPSLFLCQCPAALSRDVFSVVRDSRMWCPHDIGRDSWVWGEQETLYILNSPHEVGEEALS